MILIVHGEVIEPLARRAGQIDGRDSAKGLPRRILQTANDQKSGYLSVHIASALRMAFRQESRKTKIGGNGARARFQEIFRLSA
jgi:hypothetical protein